MDEVLILSQERVEKKVLPRMEEFKNTFFISILLLYLQDLSSSC